MTADGIKKNSYLFFLGLATAYLIFYTIYFASSDFHNYLKGYDKLFSYLAQVSILFFSVGIFAVGLKYLQLLKVFKEEFHEAIDSSKFDDKLKNNLKAITFSEEYLLEQGNLTSLWEKITLCVYRKEFPQIYEKVKKQIKNDFFKKTSISYYYKNFQLNYHITLENNILKISEKASYTLVRPNEDEFLWDFGFMYQKTENENVGIEIHGIIHSCGVKIEQTDITFPPSETHIIKKVTKQLSGHLEYIIERQLLITQDIRNDNLHSFSSDRIIDDLSVNITHSVNVNAYFTSVNNQKFYHNGAYAETKKAYINRNIFLPGEKFIIFFAPA